MESLPPARRRRRSCATPACRPDYPNDVAFRTTATGRELTRIPIPCRARPLHRARRPRHLVADARAAAPDQPALSSSRSCSRTRRRMPRITHPQPHRSSTASSQDERGVVARGAATSTAASACRSRCALSGRLRRRPLRPCAKAIGARAGRHAGHPARAVDLHPRAAAAGADARQAGVDVSRAQPAPLRHHVSRSTAGRPG